MATNKAATGHGAAAKRKAPEEPKAKAKAKASPKQKAEPKATVKKKSAPNGTGATGQGSAGAMGLSAQLARE